jgi:hypothetical protein
MDCQSELPNLIVFDGIQSVARESSAAVRNSDARRAREMRAPGDLSSSASLV